MTTSINLTALPALVNAILDILPVRSTFHNFRLTGTKVSATVGGGTGWGRDGRGHATETEPGQRGTKGLAAQHGDALVCVRFRMTLGKDDTERIRDELHDLLHHTGESLRTFSQLLEAMYEIPESDFDATSFTKVFFYCTGNLTGSHITSDVRTHCTNITRDVNRINFKVARYLRAEDLKWKDLNKSFQDLLDADSHYLKLFEDDLKDINTDLEKIFNSLHQKELTPHIVHDAWNRYQSQGQKLMDIHSKLPEPFEKLKEAEQHIRRLMT